MTELIRISHVKHLQEHELEITFDDGCCKRYNFAGLFRFQGVQAMLRDAAYFARVQVSDDHRRLFWENGYDCCADWLRYFADDCEHEWAGIADAVGLKERMQRTRANGSKR